MATTTAGGSDSQIWLAAEHYKPQTCWPTKWQACTWRQEQHINSFVLFWFIFYQIPSTQILFWRQSFSCCSYISCDVGRCSSNSSPDEILRTPVTVNTSQKQFICGVVWISVLGISQRFWFISHWRVVVSDPCVVIMVGVGAKIWICIGDVSFAHLFIPD